MKSSSLMTIVKKNFKVLFRSKSSSLIIILGPLLVIFLAGLAFDNTNVYRVNIGVYSDSYNSLSESFIENLEENRFKIAKYPTEVECEDDIKEGVIHTCIVFAPDFTMGNDEKNEIAFYVDYSRINLVYMVMETLSDKISSRSSELSLGLTTELVDAISVTEAEIANVKATIVQMTTQNEEIGGKVDTIYSSVDGLRTDAQFSDSSIEELKNKKNQIALEMGTMKDVAQTSKSKLAVLIDDIEDLIDDGILSEPVELTEILNESHEDLDEIEARIDEVVEYTDVHISELDSLVESAASQMMDAKTKLDTVGSTKESTLSELGSIKSRLDEVLANILKIQDSINKIEASIQSIQITDPGDIVNPVTTTIKPVVAKKSHLNYIFPTLVILVIMITGIMLASTLVMLEKKSSAYFRNFMTPVRDIVFVAATFITNMLLLLVQVVIIVGISSFFFGSQLLVSLPQTTVILLLAITLFTLIGMLVGYFFNSEESALLGSISIGSVFLLVSDLILPLESMPDYIIDIAKYNPFVMSGDLLRKSMVNAVSFNALWEGMLYLFGYCAAIYLLLMLVQFLSKKHYMAKYVKALAPKEEKKQ